MAGRPRGTGRPTALKIVAGERNSRVNDDEPQPDPSIPDCPSQDPKVRQVWDYTIAQLKVMRTITMADRDNLAAYCVAVVTHAQATDILAREGLVVENERGTLLRHPAQAIQVQAAQLIRQAGRDFGLNPSARTAIKVGSAQAEKPQGAARLLSG